MQRPWQSCAQYSYGLACIIYTVTVKDAWMNMIPEAKKYHTNIHKFENQFIFYLFCKTAFGKYIKNACITIIKNY